MSRTKVGTTSTTQVQGVQCCVCVLQALTPRTSRSTRDEPPLQGNTDNSKAQLGAAVSGQGETAASAVKRAFLHCKLAVEFATPCIWSLSTPYALNSCIVHLLLVYVVALHVTMVRSLVHI